MVCCSSGETYAAVAVMGAGVSRNVPISWTPRSLPAAIVVLTTAAASFTSSTFIVSIAWITTSTSASMVAAR